MAETVEMMQEQVRDDAAMTEPASIPSEPVQEEPKEAGWIKTRIQKGVEKATAELENRIRAEYEAKFAPLMEAHLNSEADKLVASGEFKRRETAVEYLKLKGSAPAEKPKEQPRDEQGRFTAQQKANELFAQAKTIQKSTGVDVMTYYHNDPDVQERVNSGEWDFSDVYKHTQQQSKAPAVVRGGSGGNIDATDISKMSSKDFKALNERLARGEKIDARR